MLDRRFQETTDDEIELLDDWLEVTYVLPIQNLSCYGHGKLFLNTYIRQLLRRSIFGCFATSKLGEKRNSHGVGTKCQPVDGFRALQNNVPNYPWADFYHRIRISSSKMTLERFDLTSCLGGLFRRGLLQRLF